WSWPKYEVLAAFDLPLDHRAAYATTSLTLTGRGDAARLQGEAITADYFGVLGIDLPIGRPFTADDSAALEVILSNGLWQERFGGDPAVIGQTVTLNGHPMNIVGIAPPGFTGLSGAAQLWVPVPAIATLVSPVRLRPQVHWLQAIGRARDDVTLAQVDERMAAAVAAVDEVVPFFEDDMVAGGAARSMSEARRNPRAQRAVLVIAVAAGMVLLIACVNLAALMLARGGERRREIAVRLALGGSRGRVARGMVCETLLLALAGGLAGAAVAAASMRAVAAMWPAAFNGGGWNLAFVDPSTFGFDASTLLYSLGLGLLAGVLFGAGPALRLSRADLGTALKAGGKSSTSEDGRVWSGRRWLVATEIAAALVLLIGAGLMLNSLARLLDIDTGFNEEGLLVFQYELPRDSFWADNPAAFHEDFLARVRALPGVESAAGGPAPLSGHHWSIVPVTHIGDEVLDDDSRRPIGIQTVTEDYFATLQTPLLRGRTFDSRDQAGGAPAVVISESATRDLFGDADPIGRALAVGYGPTSDGTPAEIIGVVADVLYDTRENGMFREAYFLQRQNPEADTQVLVRTRGEPLDVLPAVRAALAAVDPNVALAGITTSKAMAAAQVSDTRVIMELLAVFAGLSVLLAATGIWGVVSYSVVQRRRELGIRMALGARAEQAVGLILRRGLVNALVGVVAGSIAALWLSGYLESLLFEVDPADPRAFAGAAAVLFAVALLAAWIPALRATHVQPSETLRS
ncbi:MAG: ADOP family duplicated permease, partial [Acidobacteriota bacterium]